MEWIETLLTNIFNTYSKSMQVTLFSKKWWNEKVVKVCKYE